MAIQDNFWTRINKINEELNQDVNWLPVGYTLSQMDRNITIKEDLVFPDIEEPTEEAEEDE